MPRSPAGRRTLWLLSLGAVAGLAASAVGLMGSGGASTGGLPGHAIASVNGEIVRVEEYERAVQALATDRRGPIGDTEKRHVLDRLLEEELLVQRGLELGFVRHDRRVRGDIVSAVIQTAVSQGETTEPSAADVLAFYRENQDYFTRTGRVWVRQILIRAEPTRPEDEATARAEQAVARLRAGEIFDVVDAALGDPQVARIPGDYLPAPKLREYLGPTATRTALELDPGGVSEPVRSASGLHVLQLVGREDGRVPPLEDIEAEVRAELSRRAGDRALRAYLDELRERADVRVSDTLP